MVAVLLVAGVAGVAATFGTEPGVPNGVGGTPWLCTYRTPGLPGLHRRP